MTFQPSDPMVLIYNPIEKLKKLATAANIKCTEEQVINIGMKVIQNAQDFEKALGEWDSKPTASETWDNFKLHFKDAQQQLKRIRGPTMQQAGYHHANHLADQLRKDMENQNNELMTILHAKINTQSTSTSTTPSDLSDALPTQQQVNVTSTWYN